MLNASTRPRSDGPRLDRIRVGVIGTGFGAAVHIPALQQLPEIEVVAVCSRRPERAHLAAAQHGVRTAVSDYRELVQNPDIDAIVVATPPFLHHSMTLAALEAGKHVLVEKPMARSLAETRDMLNLANRAGVATMVNHEFRFIPARAMAKHLIDSGFIGEPYSASMTIFRSSLNDPNGIPHSWLMETDKAGGMLGAAGSHHVDALRWWFGEVKSVAGAIGTMVKRRRMPDSTLMGPVDADDNFSILLRFMNGALGTIHYSSTATHDASDQIVLSGSEGLLMFTSDGRLLGARRRDSLQELPVPDSFNGGLPDFDHPLIQPTALLHREWIRSIRTKKEVSPSFNDGAKVQEILDAVVRSSLQGRWIDVNKSRWQI